MTTETTQAIVELDSILKLLEAKIPANIESPENQRLIKPLERNMVEYFRRMEMSLDWGALEELYYKMVQNG